MRRLAVYAVVGAVVGAVAAIVGNLLMPDLKYGDLVTLDGVHADKIYALNKGYEIVGYFLLGSLLSSIISVLANSHRSIEIKARSFVLGLILGGPLCAGANAIVKLVCLSIARHFSPDMVITHSQSGGIHDLAFMLHYALIPTALALALTVAVGVNGFTIQRGLVSAGLASVVSGITIHTLFFILIPIMMVQSLSGGMRDFDFSALLKPLLIAHLLGMGLGAAVSFGVVQILYRAAWLRGLNNWCEGRNLPIPAPVAVIGCRPDLNMPLPADGSVAPAHAQIDSSEDRHMIRPVMGEVRVNGSPVKEAWLSDEDLVEIGSYRFRYRNRVPTTGAAPAQAMPLQVAMPISQPPTAKLQAPTALVLEDPMGGRHSLNGTVVVGRDPSADIALTWESTISRRHAEICSDATGLLVKDLGSSNGTFVNNVSISTTSPLKEGDELRLGRCVLRVKSG